MLGFKHETLRASYFHKNVHFLFNKLKEIFLDGNSEKRTPQTIKVRLHRINDETASNVGLI